MLNEYLKQVQSFVRDRDQKVLNPDDLISFINRARREIALRTQCIRLLTPVSGAIITIDVLNPGSGYTAPIVTISAPDFPAGTRIYPQGAQATATAQIIAGQISNVSVDFGGSGYTVPTVTINDPTGTGAELRANVQPINVTQGGQEIYQFSDVPLQTFAGVGEILFVRSISFIYSNFRYSLPCYPFSIYQSFIRQYPLVYQYVPTMCAQLGQGTNGSIYMYPIPSSLYRMEWDCSCLPLDLSSDSDVEAIAKPWTDCVPICAAVYAFEELQNLNAARYYREKTDLYCGRYSQWTRPGRATNLYGRF